MDVARGVPVRFTFDAGRDAAPVWSADGKAIAWQGNTAMFMKDSSGTRPEERVRDEPWIPDDWLPDGSGLVCHPNAPLQIVIIPMVGTDRTPQAVVEGRTITTQGRLSPDGRWIAFASSDSGRFEVYVQNFPKPAGRWQVSTDGGLQPKWRSDGKELYYLGLDSRLMAAPVALGALAEVGKPAPLFATRVEPTTGLRLAPLRCHPRWAAVPDQHAGDHQVGGDGRAELAGLSPAPARGSVTVARRRRDADRATGRSDWRRGRRIGTSHVPPMSGRAASR